MFVDVSKAVTGIRPTDIHPVSVRCKTTPFSGCLLLMRTGCCCRSRCATSCSWFRSTSSPRVTTISISGSTGPRWTSPSSSRHSTSSWPSHLAGASAALSRGVFQRNTAPCLVSPFRFDGDSGCCIVRGNPVFMPASLYAHEVSNQLASSLGLNETPAYEQGLSASSSSY